MSSIDDVPQDRNNTSFQYDLWQYFKNIPKNTSPIRYHQLLASTYIAQSNHRGILIYHEMGSGKTILGASICEALRNQKKYKKIIFISAKSLHSNFEKDFIKYHELMAKHENRQINLEAVKNILSTEYNFISLNASNMFEQVQRTDKNSASMMLDEDLPKDQRKKSSSGFANLNNCVIIWDEFHNFLNSVCNGSKNAVALYDSVMKAKNIKLIGLTGTPIISDPYECAIGFNMFSGYTDKEALFGEDYLDFTQTFITKPEAVDSVDTLVPMHMKNKDKFQDRIFGLVSYYGSDSPEIKSLYPLEYELVLKKVPMSSKQYSAYSTAREREMQEGKSYGAVKKARLQKPGGSSSSSYRVRTRQLSNFIYPDYAKKPSDNPKKDGSRHPELLKDHCWKVFPIKTGRSETECGLETWSPKILALLKNISLHSPPGILDEFKPPKTNLAIIMESRNKLNQERIKNYGLTTYELGIGPGGIYSQFRDSGVEPISLALKFYGFTIAKSVEELIPGKHCVGILSGEVLPEERARLISAYNSPENADGSVIFIMLFTSTGAEGIELRRSRHIHFLEPYWHMARIRQVITRAVRTNSHLDLPKNKQTVQPYGYFSDYPNSLDSGKKEKQDALNNMKKLESTTDVTLYTKALQNQALIDDFLSAIKSASIDCAIHYNNDKVKCRICTPNNKLLWHGELHVDMERPSPCHEYKGSTKAMLITITFNGKKKEYAYQKNPLKIFVKQANGHFKALDSNSAEWFMVTEEIKKIDES